MKCIRWAPLLLALFLVASPALAASHSQLAYYYTGDALQALGAGASVGGLSAVYLS